MKAQLDRDGYAVIRGAVPIELVVCVKQQLARRIAGKPIELAEHDGAVIAAFQQDRRCHHRRFDELGPSAFDLIFCGVFYEAAQEALRADLTLNPTQHVRAKLPTALYETATGKPDPDVVPWHQDAFASDGHPSVFNMLTFWVPLAPVSQANGTLGVYLGSHRKGSLFHRAHGLSVNEAKAIWIDARPGDFVVFHKHLVHGSGLNSTSGIRWSLDFRVQSAGADCGRKDASSIPFVMLARGDRVRRSEVFGQWLAQQNEIGTYA